MFERGGQLEKGELGKTENLNLGFYSVCLFFFIFLAYVLITVLSNSMLLCLKLLDLVQVLIFILSNEINYLSL